MLSLERWAGGQPTRDPVYRISRESGPDPKGYRSRIGRDMLPSERLANRDPKSTRLAMVPSHHLGSRADLEIHPLALPQTVLPKLLRTRSPVGDKSFVYTKD